MSDYRHSALRCPGCNALLEEQTRAAVRVEICNGCSGLFVDWLDGEVTAVVRKVAPLPAVTGPEGQGSGACPHCAIELHAEVFDGVQASVLAPAAALACSSRVRRSMHCSRTRRPSVSPDLRLSRC